MKCDICSNDRSGADVLCSTCRETMRRLVRICAKPADDCETLDKFQHATGKSLWSAVAGRN